MYGVHSIPFERAAAVAPAIPGGQLIAIPGAAHDLPNEDPAGFIAALRVFLTETPTKTEQSLAHTEAGFKPES
jgi:pimeloyl-ACP methyl ester carboxylesterase